MNVIKRAFWSLSGRIRRNVLYIWIFAVLFFVIQAGAAIHRQLGGKSADLDNAGTLTCMAGAVLLILFFLHTFFERRNETAILLDLGEKRWKLTGQWLIETAVISGIGFGLASFSGGAAIPHIENHFPPPII